MVLVRFEPLNPLTPNPDFGNLFCVFWQAIGELQFLVSMFPATYSEFERARFFLPASYCGVALCMILCFGKVLGGSHVEGLVVATSYCETHMEGLAAFQGIPLWKVLRRFDFQGQQRALNLLFPESRLCGTI